MSTRGSPWPALLLLLAATLVASPSASAQGPEGCELTLVQGGDDPATSGFPPGVTRTFTLLVTNTGELPARGNLELNDPPPGWFWDSSTRTVDLAQDESVTFSIPVAFDGSTRLDATLEAWLEAVRCTIGGVVLTEVAGTPNGEVTMALTPAPPTPVEPDEGALWPWLLFGALVLGTIVAIPLLYRGRRVAIEAFTEEPERTVIPGRGTSFPLVLRNRTNRAVHVTLEVTEVKEGWSALVTLPDLELGPKESRTLYMMVRAPAEARPGDLCVAKLNARPEGGSARAVSTVTKVVEAGPEKKGGKKGG